jgi:hypothetical protein
LTLGAAGATVPLETETDQKEPRMSLLRRAPSAVLLAACLISLVGCASTGPQPVGLDPANRVIDVRADEQVRRMSDYLAGLQRFRFEADITYDDFLVETQKVQYAKRGVVEVQRPNRCRGVITGDVENKKHWYDGKQVVSLDVDKNCYASFDVPDTIDAMLSTMAEQYNTALPLTELIASNAYDWLMSDVVTARYVGRSRVAGVDCHHLAFEQSSLNWQLWVEDGEHPFPRRILIVYKHMDEAPQYEATFTRWDAAPTLTDQDFAVALPPNAVRVETPAADAVAAAGKSPN